MIRPDEYETGSGGFVWKNRFPDPLWSQLRLHLYTAHRMTAGVEWQGEEFVNHYNRLYYVVDGEAELIFNDKVIKMRPGFLYLIPPYQLISHRAQSSLDFYWCHFQAHLNDALDFFILYGDATEYDCRYFPNMEQSFKQLVDFDADESIAAVFERQGLLSQLLKPYFDELDRNGLEENKFKHQSLLPAMQCINENISAPPSIHSLAELSNLSIEHFSRKFKAAVNISPKRYILTRQLSLAKQQLLAANNRIDVIAYSCGIGDIYHFSKTFKQETGMSPSQFRKGYEVQTA